MGARRRFFSYLKRNQQMLENTAKSNHTNRKDSSVVEQPLLPLASLEKHTTVELAAHLNVPLSETEKLLGTKPIYFYPKDGLYGLL
jgi:hypothetical protein